MALKKDMESRAQEKVQESGLSMKDNGNLEPFLIRLSGKDKLKLRIYFHNKGLKLSQGIRMIVKEYMEREGI